jgi:hypothetical protein
MGEYWWEGGRGWGVTVAIAVSGMLVCFCLALSLPVAAANEGDVFYYEDRRWDARMKTTAALYRSAVQRPTVALPPSPARTPTT